MVGVDLYTSSFYSFYKEDDMRKILCFGDSNTYGLIPGTEDRYSKEIRRTGRIQTNLLVKGYEIIEEGLCGRTTVFDVGYQRL